jgi:hypothetical protein
MTIQLGPIYFIGFTTTIGAIVGGKGALVGLAVGLGTALIFSFRSNRYPL